MYVLFQYVIPIKVGTYYINNELFTAFGVKLF